MKKKALATKMAAFVMAGAMTMAMGFPALADETQVVAGSSVAGDDASTLTTITFTKRIEDKNTKANTTTNEAENVYAPNTKFKFSLTKGSAGKITEGNNKEVPVIAGMTETNGTLIGIALTNEYITMSPELTGTSNTGDGTITVNYQALYDAAAKPGVYHYQLTEVAPSQNDEDESYRTVYDGMSYEGANTTYDIYVFLYDKESKNKNSVVVKKGDAIYKADKLEFKNSYTTYNLDVKKIVTGNQGIKAKDYKFDITINGASDEKYKYKTYTVNGTTETEVTDKAGELTSGRKAEITLQSDQVIRIFGLSERDTYEVKESGEYAADGYTTTVSVNGGAASETLEAKSSENSVLSSDVSILYTNDKTITTPTGIVTEYAPYILLVAAAGAFAVLFLRRKKEEF